MISYPIVLSSCRLGVVAILPTTFFRIVYSPLIRSGIFCDSKVSYDLKDSAGKNVIALSSAVSVVVLIFCGSYKTLRIQLVHSTLTCLVIVASHTLLTFGIGFPISNSFSKFFAVSLNSLAFFCFWLSCWTPYNYLVFLGVSLHVVVALFLISKNAPKIRLICGRKASLGSKAVFDPTIDVWNVGIFLIAIIYFWTSLYKLDQIREPGHHLENLIYVVVFAVVAASCNDENMHVANNGASEIASDLNTAFVRFISHELLSHLNHLNLGLQILLEETPREERSRYAGITDLQDTCDNAQQVMNEIAMLTELQSSKKKKKKTLASCGWALKFAIKNIEKNVR